jgi:magnesium-dependent phosphatase 1
VNHNLFVFDLDYTLWDANGSWCDCTYPPYKLINGIVHDKYDAKIQLYPEVISILKELQKRKKQIAIASRTESPSNAVQLISLLKFDHFINYQEIFPASKIQHFKNIAKNSGINYSQMIFFDDESRNIADVSSLGVECVHVNHGVNLKLVSPFW